MIHEIQGQKVSSATAGRVVQELLSVLASHHAKIISHSGDQIEFTMPLIQARTSMAGWILFNKVSHGIFTVESREGSAMIIYRFSLYRMRIFLSIATVALISISPFCGKGQMIFPGLFFLWGLAYPLNYAMTRALADQYFCNLIKKLNFNPPPLPRLGSL